MAASFLPLRILLGALCAFFAHYLGRSLAARSRARATNAQVMRWGLRVVVTGLGAAWGALDWITFLSLGLAASSGGFGFYLLWRPQPPEEDLTREMFPKE